MPNMRYTTWFCDTKGPMPHYEKLVAYASFIRTELDEVARQQICDYYRILIDLSNRYGCWLTNHKQALEAVINEVSACRGRLARIICGFTVTLKAYYETEDEAFVSMLAVSVLESGVV